MCVCVRVRESVRECVSGGVPERERYDGIRSQHPVNYLYFHFKTVFRKILLINDYNSHVSSYREPFRATESSVLVAQNKNTIFTLGNARPSNK